jgi:hypothetical protein
MKRPCWRQVTGAAGADLGHHDRSIVIKQVSFLLGEIELHRVLGDGNRGKARKNQKCGDEEFHIAEYVLGAGICGFSFMPMFLAVGIVAEGVFLFFLVLCIDAGDLLLDFALEDERFFDLATRCHALSIFEVTEF